MDANRGRGLIEILLSIVVIAVFLSVYARAWIVNLSEAREVALENQLTNLKHSLELYMIVEGHYPVDLRALNKSYNLSAEDSLYERRYLELQAQDKEGYPVDPYGRRFIYNSEKGTVKRRTE